MKTIRRTWEGARDPDRFEHQDRAHAFRGCWLFYLHSGQQPLPVSFVAAAAVVANSAKIVALSASSLDVIRYPFYC